MGKTNKTIFKKNNRNRTSFSGWKFPILILIIIIFSYSFRTLRKMLFHDIISF